MNNIPEWQHREMLHKEKLLWEEVRSLRNLMFSLCQWGISTLVGMMTALFFIRKSLYDHYEHLIVLNQIKNGEEFPSIVFCYLETGALSIVAIIFAIFTYHFGERYQKYKKLLSLENNNICNIPISETKSYLKWITILLYFIIPVLDWEIQRYS